MTVRVTSKQKNITFLIMPKLSVIRYKRFLMVSQYSYISFVLSEKINIFNWKDNLVKIGWLEHSILKDVTRMMKITIRENTWCYLWFIFCCNISFLGVIDLGMAGKVSQYLLKKCKIIIIWNPHTNTQILL